VTDRSEPMADRLPSNGSDQLGDQIRKIRSIFGGFGDRLLLTVPDNDMRFIALKRLASVQEQCEQACWEEFRGQFMLGTSGIDGRNGGPGASDG
jgi:hypothetical protein